MTYSKHKKLNPTNKYEGYVYLVDIGFDDLYKIGKTTRVGARMSSLRCSNPRIKLLCAYKVKNMHYCEKALHDRFSILNYKNEIFKLAKENIKWIRNYLAQQHVQYLDGM
jgi:hypothetical protein